MAQSSWEAFAFECVDEHLINGKGEASTVVDLVYDRVESMHSRKSLLSRIRKRWHELEPINRVALTKLNSFLSTHFETRDMDYSELQLYSKMANLGAMRFTDFTDFLSSAEDQTTRFYETIKSHLDSLQLPGLSLLVLREEDELQLQNYTLQKAEQLHTQQAIQITPEIKDHLISLAHFEFDKSVPDWRGLLLSICLVTGRRAVEVGICGQFESTENNEFRFTGKAKRRRKDLPETPLIFPPLSGFHCNTIMEKIRILRRLLLRKGIKAQSDFNRKVSTPTPRYLRKQWNQPDLKPHDLRRFYAYISFQEVCPENMSFLGWSQKVLGHENIMTSQRYTNISV